MTTNGKNFLLLTFSWAQIMSMRICISPADGPWLPRLVSCLTSCMDQPRPCFFNANRWPVAQYTVSYINVMLHAQTGVEEGNSLCMFDFCQRYHSSTSQYIRDTNWNPIHVTSLTVGSACVAFASIRMPMKRTRIPNRSFVAYKKRWLVPKE